MSTVRAMPTTVRFIKDTNFDSYVWTRGQVVTLADALARLVVVTGWAVLGDEPPVGPPGGGELSKRYGILDPEQYRMVTAVTNQTLPKLGWVTVGDGPFAYEEPAYDVGDGILYTVGGYAYAAASAVPYLLRFDIMAGGWLPAVDLPTTVESPSGIAPDYPFAGFIGDRLYFGGGSSDETGGAKQLWSYQPATGVFTRLADKAVSQTFGSYAVADGLLWTIQGTKVETYDPVSNTWTAKADLAAPLSGHEKGVQVGRKVYWPGLNKVLDLDQPDGTGWAAISEADVDSRPPEGAECGTAVMDGLVYVSAGDKLWVFDPGTDQYTSVAGGGPDDLSALGGTDGRLVVLAGGGSTAAFVLDQPSCRRPGTFLTGRLSVGGGYASGVGALAAGLETRARGAHSVAAGKAALAEGEWSTASGMETVASGAGADASGLRSRAVGGYSHAEGNGSRSEGLYSHAEGESTATGRSSHAEGAGSRAVGAQSHAEGSFGHAQENFSHARGGGTFNNASVLGQSQFVSRQIKVETTSAAAATLGLATLHPDRVGAFEALVAARKTDGTVGAAWRVTAMVRVATNGVTTVVNPQIVSLGADAGAATWAVSVADNGTANSTVKLTVTGQAATTIRWSARVDTQEIG